MRMNKLLSLLVVSLVALPVAAWADAPRHVINDSGVTTTLDCGAGGDVVLNGSAAELTVTGACAKIVVNGSRNTVALDAVDKVQLNGSANTVTWKKGWKKKAPKVVKLGTGNKTGKVK